MFAENGKISLRQLQVLLLLDSFGTAVLFLPSELAQMSGRSCWLVALAGGLFFIPASFLLAKAGEKRGSVAEWCLASFGKGLGTIFLLGLAVKMLLEGSLELYIFSEIICRNMLPHTPVWVISLVILLVAGMLAFQGAECRGRTGEILFFLVLIPLAVVLTAVALSAEYGRIRPLEWPSLTNIRQGIFSVSILFQGLTFLYFVPPFLRKKGSREVVVSSFVTVLTLTVVVFLCLAVYGEGILSAKLLPTLQMMERVSFTGIFLTRQDVLLLWFWMASVCIFLSGIVFYGALLMADIFPRQEQKTWRLLWGAGLFFLTFLPQDVSVAYRFRLQFLPWLQLFYLLLLPCILLVKKGGRKDV